MDFQQWLFDRNIDCQTLTPELLASLLSQFEADCKQAAPPSEMLVSNDSCPAKTHRLPMQPTLFDCSPEYQ